MIGTADSARAGDDFGAVPVGKAQVDDQQVRAAQAHGAQSLAEGPDGLGRKTFAPQGFFHEAGDGGFVFDDDGMRFSGGIRFGHARGSSGAFAGAGD